jgi:transcriptional regulator with XRE-family HTH domain
MLWPASLSFRAKADMPPADLIARSSAAVSGLMSIPGILDSFSIYARKSIFPGEYPTGMSIHKRIREGREALKLSEEEFAKRCGVSRGAVQHWEREDGTAPNRARQAKVAEVLGISVSELVGEGDAKKAKLPVKPPSTMELVRMLASRIAELDSTDRKAAAAILHDMALSPEAADAMGLKLEKLLDEVPSLALAR